MGMKFNPLTGNFDIAGSSGGGGAVDSVNGQTGVVVLDADDVGAANQELSNLDATTAINSSLLPDANISYTLGNSGQNWQEVHTTAIISNDELIIGAATSINASGLNITNVAGPSNPNDAANMDYVDSSLNGKANTDLSNIGSTLIPADLIPDSNISYSLGSSGTNWQATHTTTVQSNDELFLVSDFGTINVSGALVTNAADPVDPQDLATKNYVDTGVNAANKTLSNLEAPTAINQNLLPDTNATYLIGDTGAQFSNIYSESLQSDIQLTLNAGADLVSSAQGDSYIYAVGGTILLIPDVEISANNKNITNVADPVNLQDVATKNYVDNAGSGASTSLNNLTSTSINADLIPDGNMTRDLGSFSNRWDLIVGRDGVFGGSSPSTEGSLAVSRQLGSISVTDSGQLAVPNSGTGMIIANGTNSSNLQIFTKNTTSGNTGNISLQSGNASSGNSGDVVIQPGTASATKGKISLNDTFHVRRLEDEVDLTWGGPIEALTVNGANTNVSADGGAGLVFDGTSAQGNLTILTTDQLATSSAPIYISSGYAPNDSSGSVSMYTGDGDSASGGINFGTGNSTGQSGNVSIASGSSSAADSGPIVIATGTAGGTRGKIDLSASTVDFNQTPAEAFVLENGATGSRPGTPVLAQMFFDTTLGIPIWYDGTNWIDATGTTV